MKTGNLEYTRSFYSYVSSNKGKNTDQKETFRDYLITDINKLQESSLLTKKIRIEKDNGFHKRSRFFEYWLYFRDETNWKRCTKTGLAITNYKFIFEGNIPEKIDLNQKNEKGKEWENPKHLIIMQFIDDTKIIILDVFKDFYPHKKDLINLIISEHDLLD